MILYHGSYIKIETLILNTQEKTLTLVKVFM